MIKSILLWGTAVLLIAVIGLAGVLMSTLPPPRMSLAAAGLSAPVDIRFDRHGVPRIRAASRDDAAFALGFVHARDRLWQMEAMRRLGAGRLSEVLGARTLGTDRFMRTLGLYRAAERAFHHLSPEVRANLLAYAEGVNRWIEIRRDALPPEFLLLRHRPEPWRPADSLVWGKLMAMTLSGNYRGELLRARLLGRLTSDEVDSLWPRYPADGPVTIEPEQQAMLDLGIGADAAAALGIRPLGLPSGASNAWVIAGEHTASGKPLLANDPHLGFAAPIPWYLARIDVDGLRLAGGTAPGVPFLVVGHNGHIAWGLTATQSDLQDIFVEKQVPGDPDHYLTPAGPRAFQARDELIKVRRGRDVVLRVRESRHGPVLSDVLGRTRSILTLGATFLDADDRSAEALFRLNGARNRQEFLAAAAHMGAPQINITYADKTGGIGFIAPGNVPVRGRGTGFLPSPGEIDIYDWQGYLPFALLPRRFDPPGGRLWNANNPVAGPGFPHFITRDWAAPYRAQRLQTLLAERAGKWSLDDMARMQLDYVSEMARTLVPVMTGWPAAEPEVQAVLDGLRAWDGAMDRDRAEPLLFTAWLRRLNRAIYADDLGPDFRAYWRLRPEFILHVLTRDNAWCGQRDSGQPPDCESLLKSTLAEILRDLADRFGPDAENWKWGTLHRATFRHRLFDAVPPLRPFANFSAPSHGGDFTLNRGGTRIANDVAPHEHIHGAGYRGIYDLGDPGKSRFILATGQSGNFLSRHYGSLFGKWLEGGYIGLEDEDAFGPLAPQIKLRPARAGGSRG